MSNNLLVHHSEASGSAESSGYVASGQRNLSNGEHQPDKSIDMDRHSHGCSGRLSEKELEAHFDRLSRLSDNDSGTFFGQERVAPRTSGESREQSKHQLAETMLNHIRAKKPGFYNLSPSLNQITD